MNSLGIWQGVRVSLQKWIEPSAGRTPNQLTKTADRNRRRHHSNTQLNSIARSLALRHLPKGSNVDRRGTDAYYILAYGSVARRPDLKGNVCVLSVGIPLLRVVQNIRT